MDIPVADEDESGVVSFPSVRVALISLDIVQDHTPIVLQGGRGVAGAWLPKILSMPERWKIQGFFHLAGCHGYFDYTFTDRQ